MYFFFFVFRASFLLDENFALRPFGLKVGQQKTKRVLDAGLKDLKLTLQSLEGKRKRRSVIFQPETTKRTIQRAKFMVTCPITLIEAWYGVATSAYFRVFSQYLISLFTIVYEHMQIFYFST